MTTPPIRHSIVVNAPIARVWRALTAPEEVANWINPVGFRAEVGAKFHFQSEPQRDWDGITYSELVVLEEPTMMAFTWFVPGMSATLVTFRLRDLGEQTEVTLEHAGWEQFPPEVQQARDQLNGDWGSSVLDKLTRVVEQG